MTQSRNPPAWRGAFLRALARTGSVAAAAEACGIDRTSAYQLRKRNPAFAQSWARAVESAQHSLSPGDPKGGGSQRGDVPGTSAPSPETPASAGAPARGKVRRPLLRPHETIRASKTGKLCIMRTGPGRWNAKAEALFLAELAETANVKAAARAAGVSTQAAYARRKLWPAFAEQWRAAVAECGANLETLVVCAATTTLDPEPLPERAPDAERMSMDQALKVWLALNARDHAPGRRRLGGPMRREPDIEEVRQEILRKVAAIRRAKAMRG